MNLHSSDPRWPTIRSSLWRTVREHGLVIALYTVLAVLMTWPLSAKLSYAVSGEGVDTWQNIWNLWWLKEALLHSHNPFFTTYVQYPDGTSLLLHTLNPFNFLITLPVQALFGLIVAHSLFQASFTLYGVALPRGYKAIKLRRSFTTRRRILAGRCCCWVRSASGAPEGGSGSPMHGPRPRSVRA